jgi:multiple sugar transport system permease protein
MAQIPAARGAIQTTQDVASAAQARAQRRRRLRLDPGNVTGMAFLFIVTAYFLLPVYWVIVASEKNSGDLFSSFGLWFSGRVSWGTNLYDLFTYDGGIYIRWILNTALYALVGAVVGTFLAMMAGYAMAKYVFPGRTLIFNIILGAILVPATALALPLYLLMHVWGLTNTFWSVLLPSFVNPFGVYLARIYAAASVPDDLLEAARVDGSGEFNVFWRIALPILTPAMVTIFLFEFVAIWNNFFLPLIMLSTQNLYPLTLGLDIWDSLTTSAGAPAFIYQIVITGALISVIPLVIGFLLLQRFWRSGLTVGAVKG